MQTWGDRFSSPICSVGFAGFRSTTWDLQRNGWDVTLREHELFSRAERVYSLAMRHSQAKVYALTNSWHCPTWSMLEHLKQADWTKFCHFEVCHVANEFQFQVMPEVKNSFRAFALDCRPEFEVGTERIDIENFIPFRTVSDKAPELIVDPEKVGEIMDLILKAQDPKQAEMREKRRREAWRQDDQGKRVDNFTGYNSRADIRAQIISLAG